MILSVLYIFGLFFLNNVECMEKYSKIRAKYDTGGVDVIYSMTRISGNRTVITGYTNGYGVENVLVMMMSESGMVEKVFTHGSASYNEQGEVVKETLDGGFIILGKTSYNSGQLILAKYDSEGNSGWIKRFGSSTDAAQDLAVCADGGYLYTGISFQPNGQIHVMKLTQSGAIEWGKYWGGENNADMGYGIVEAYDQNIYVTGHCWDHCPAGNGHLCGYLMKLSSTGTLSYKNGFGGDGQESVFTILQRPSDSRLVLGGETFSSPASPGDFSFFLCLFELSGAMVWCKGYGTTGSNKMKQRGGVFMGEDESMVLVGYSYDPEESNLFIKVDSDGVVEFARYFPTTLTPVVAHAAVEDGNGYLFAGPDNNDISLHKMNSSGYSCGNENGSLITTVDFTWDVENIPPTESGVYEPALVDFPMDKSFREFPGVVECYECVEGLYGDGCNLTMCGIYFSNDTDNVCSGHGVCEFPGVCDCDDNWAGGECSIDNRTYYCQGVPSYETGVVCSGNGECVKNGTCECVDWYAGKDCSSHSYFMFLKGAFDINDEVSDYSCLLPQSFPSGRAQGMAFTFPHYNSYLFGGKSDDGCFNDVWLVDSTDVNFCFVKGIDKANSNESNYEAGVLAYSPANDISARHSFGGFSSLFSFLVFGGQLGDGEVVNDLWEFHINIQPEVSHQWRILKEQSSASETHPAPRRGLCSAKIDSFSFYFFGGEEHNSNDNNNMYKNDLWKYDSLTNSFELIKNGTNGTFDTIIDYSSLVAFNYSDEILPYHRSGHICWVNLNKLNMYVFGGTLSDLSSSNDVFVFNSTRSQWAYVTGGKTNHTNSVSAEHTFHPLNLPSIRTGPSYANNQMEFSLWDEVVFFGGLDLVKGKTNCDLWAFSNVLHQFMLVNGTGPIQGKVNLNFFEIGSRAYAQTVFKRNQKILIFGGFTIT